MTDTIIVSVLLFLRPRLCLATKGTVSRKEYKTNTKRNTEGQNLELQMLVSHRWGEMNTFQKEDRNL